MPTDIRTAVSAARISVNQIKPDELEEYVRQRVREETGRVFMLLQIAVAFLLLSVVSLAVVAFVALAPSAHADVLFEACPDGREGIVGAHTSCDFAENVRKEFFLLNQRRYFNAYSPVTNDTYAMDCFGNKTITFIGGARATGVACYTDTGAEVVIW